MARSRVVSWIGSAMAAGALGLLIGTVTPVPAPATAAGAGITHLAPPKGRTGTKRIMDPALPAPSGAARRGGYGPEAFKWFWTEVSTAASAARAERWAEIAHIIERARTGGRAVFGSQASIRAILDAYGPIAAAEARRRNVSLPLVLAVIAVESGGNPQAVSPKGAGGLMQLMPQTAARFGVSNAMAPAQNIRGGTQYLDWLLRTFRDDAVLALAGYNAGEGAVWKHDGVPPYNETRDYVAKVAGAYSVARRLCRTPPVGPRGLCEID